MKCERCGCEDLVKMLIEWSNKDEHEFYECFECTECYERNNIIEVKTQKRVNELNREFGF